MKKWLIKLSVFSLCLLLLAGCTKITDNTQTTIYSTEGSVPSTTQAPVPTQAVSIAPPTTIQAPEGTITEVITDSVTLSPAPVPSAQATTEANQESSTTDTTRVIEKTGEMAFSDNPGNRYISSVSQKYEVPAERLVALYTVPENDSNIVLEFDGTQNDDGTLIRNKKTLVAIYSIDKALNSKRASESSSLNEYSYGEMKVMFFTTTTYIMPEFEELK